MITKSVFASEQYVDEKIGEIIENGSSNVSTPDWNQNDSTATDYIKNRPFYEDENGVHVIDPKFLPEHEHSEIENLISQEISKLETYISNEIQKIPDVSTPDWNENDPTSAGYIENRPFYEFSNETDLIVFSTSSSDWHINNNGPIASGEFYNTSYVNTFTIGETYTAVINGVKYTDVAKDATAEWGSSAVAIGQVESLLTDDITNFTYTIINSDNMLMVYYKSDVAPTECRLVSFSEQIQKIDPKYLPDMNVDMTGYATEEFATNAAAAIKDDLLNGAGEAYDTLKELGELIDENHNALEALETIANGKADADHTHDDKYVTKDETNAIQLITIEEIDQICNTGIQFANLDEVNF